jgi:hypothetical protein
MATQLDLVNNVLLRVREKQVVNVTDNTYSQLVAQIVAESYEEVLDEWNWRSLSETSVFALPAGSTGGPAADFVVGGFLAPDARLFLARAGGAPYARVIAKPYVIDLFEDNAGSQMTELTLPQYSDMVQRQTEQASQYPQYFSLRPLPDESLDILFWQPAKTDCSVAMTYWRRPNRLTSDGTTQGANIEIPFRPVQELALMYALNERGEEMGEPGNLAERRYMQALSAAKELDLKAAEQNNSGEWRRD